jgi:uncharacterized protein (TIGR04255 family)
MTAIEDPLIAPLPKEVPLDHAPLVRVIAQVRFPLVVAIEQRDFIAPFQEAIRLKYPILRQEQTRGVLVSQAGVASAPAQTVWRFGDVQSCWRVSLAPDFLALETTAYTSRSDFLARLREVIVALDKYVEPKVVDRLGVRYIDRIVGAPVGDIAKLVRPEIRGITGTPAASHAVHSLSESMFTFGGSRVVARWGLLPAGATVDPSAIEPTNEASWILDIDMFSSESMPFAIDPVLNNTRQFAERIYTFFRWAVTDDFLRLYGGRP